MLDPFVHDMQLGILASSGAGSLVLMLRIDEYAMLCVWRVGRITLFEAPGHIHVSVSYAA